MKALLITIGDEILLGNVINTNAAFIGRKLAEYGIFMAENLTVGDKSAEIYRAIESGMSNFDIVISTGGLGPTVDDITKTEIARYFKQKLILDEDLLAVIKKRFDRRGITMSETNICQAMVPENCQLIKNPKGTAPGLILQKGERIFFALPGVPDEMEWLLSNGVIPKLKNKGGKKVISYRMLLTAGVPESTLAERLKPVTSRQQEFSLAFLPAHFRVRLRITVYQRPKNETESILANAENQIREIIGDDIYGVDDDTLEQIVGQLLIKQQKTIAVAESCTGGLITNWLTDVPGSSTYFERGAVTYSNQSKTELLNISPASIEKFGAVSKQVAKEMAEGIRRNANTNIGLSTTGIAGPTGATPTKPIGLVYIGLSTENETLTSKNTFPGNRIDIKNRSAWTALNLVRKYLLNIKQNRNVDNKEFQYTSE